MRSSSRASLIFVGALVAAALLLFAGMVLAMNPTIQDSLRVALPASWVGKTSELQQEVLRKLESSYYKEVDPAILEEEAVSRMVASLDDPYTVYLDPAAYADLLEHTQGSYSGVGMTFEMKDRLPTIVSVFRGSPADQAGIRTGDIIVAVDGVEVGGQTLDEVAADIRGEEDTQVRLEWYRPAKPTTTTTVTEASDAPDAEDRAVTPSDVTGETIIDLAMLPPGGESFEFTLTRKTIDIPVVETEALEVEEKDVALIRFATFSEGSADKLREEVRNAVEDQQVEAIILDLRSNGGGLLDEAVDVASIFIPEGVIVSTEGLHSPEQVYTAEGGAYTQTPLYVLTDAYTASASEIVSGALQDGSRAVVVGETTFGKGLVQVIEPLSNGGALKVTTAVYLTPEGRDINKKGIEPDVLAPDDPETEDVDECIETALGLIGGRNASN